MAGIPNILVNGGMGMGSSIASMFFLYALFHKYCPTNLQHLLQRYTQKLFSIFNPYIEICIHEYSGDRWTQSEAYVAIQTYVGTLSSTEAKRLEAYIHNDSKKLSFSLGDYEEVSDLYQGTTVWWKFVKVSSKTQSISFYPSKTDEKKYYKLTFHRKNRELVTNMYLNHVLQVGKALAMKCRKKKLYTNKPMTSWDGGSKSMWSSVSFDHPSTFKTLALEADKKKDIIDDLITFSKGKEYYAKIGKAWKRGYLLYGPPGTGKSTMIAAIANYMDYDIYDVELTTVKSNNELRKLLIGTSNKAVIVIEDIDCSLDLTGQRKQKVEKEDPIVNAVKEDNKVTLSGLLNFIDGLWSACGGERIVVFTTNYVEKLDPALIRRGRMDKHIEMSYCGFEAFKVLAKNYLDLDSHHLFETIERLLGQTRITPADTAEYLMPKTRDDNFVELCLEELIEALKQKESIEDEIGEIIQIE
ncbi:hypothetical protein ACHQM5_006001 [Ranunculus cassubicifolius]